MFKSTSASPILLGILAVIVGIFAIAWPGVTILARSSCSRFTCSRTRGWRAAGLQQPGRRAVVGHLRLRHRPGRRLFASRPAPTAFVLVIAVAAWALVGGVAEFSAGFQAGEGVAPCAVHHVRAGVGRVRRLVRPARRGAVTWPGVRRNTPLYGFPRSPPASSSATWAETRSRCWNCATQRECPGPRPARHSRGVSHEPCPTGQAGSGRAANTVPVRHGRLRMRRPSAASRWPPSS